MKKKDMTGANRDLPLKKSHRKRNRKLTERCCSFAFMNTFEKCEDTKRRKKLSQNSVISCSKASMTMHSCLSLVGCYCLTQDNKVHDSSSACLDVPQAPDDGSQCEPYHISGNVPDIIDSHNTASNERCRSIRSPDVNSVNASDVTRGYNASIIYVEHFRQHFYWDCGIACIMMILSDANKKHLWTNLSKICQEEGFNNSTWTIDLAYLLHKFNISFRYFTVTIGVDDGLNNEEFYQKVLKTTQDEERVEKRFKEASSLGIIVEQKSISFDEIVQHLNRGLPVILLTNANMFNCVMCQSNIHKCFKSCSSSHKYRGHYILLRGYDGAKKLVYYSDPTNGHKLCCCPLNSIEEARLSYGTDEDVIFIDKFPILD